VTIQLCAVNLWLYVVWGILSRLYLFYTAVWCQSLIAFCVCHINLTKHTDNIQWKVDNRQLYIIHINMTKTLIQHTMKTLYSCVLSTFDCMFLSCLCVLYTAVCCQHLIVFCLSIFVRLICTLWKQGWQHTAVYNTHKHDKNIQTTYNQRLTTHSCIKYILTVCVYMHRCVCVDIGAYL
jgi:hypothetical protein